MHVRLNENGVSDECLAKLGLAPIDAAYAVVEYVLRKYSEKLERAGARCGGGVKVENLVDVKRVFTAPLSLHRELDRVAVCFKPDHITSFTLEWVRPDSFKHFGCWGVYDDGELDELVKRAVEVVGRGGRHGRVEAAVARRQRVREGTVARHATVAGRVGRFQVMGLLQAARYYLLYRDLNKAKPSALIELYSTHGPNEEGRQ